MDTLNDSKQEKYLWKHNISYLIKLSQTPSNQPIVSIPLSF